MNKTFLALLFSAAIAIIVATPINANAQLSKEELAADQVWKQNAFEYSRVIARGEAQGREEGRFRAQDMHESAQQKRNELVQAKRKIQIFKCMRATEANYINSVKQLCNNPNINCKAMVGTYSPKLLEPLINTLSKEQDICIKLAGI
jgi:hypothetical protein